MTLAAESFYRTRRGAPPPAGAGPEAIDGPARDGQDATIAAFERVLAELVARSRGRGAVRPERGERVRRTEHPDASTRPDVAATATARQAAVGPDTRAAGAPAAQEYTAATSASPRSAAPAPAPASRAAGAPAVPCWPTPGDPRSRRSHTARSWRNRRAQS